jgi:hypothetical protein
VNTPLLSRQEIIALAFASPNPYTPSSSACIAVLILTAAKTGKIAGGSQVIDFELKINSSTFPAQ